MLLRLFVLWCVVLRYSLFYFGFVLVCFCCVICAVFFFFYFPLWCGVLCRIMLCCIMLCPEALPPYHLSWGKKSLLNLILKQMTFSSRAPH